MKLDFNFRFKDLSGKDLQGESGLANKMLANVLSNQNKGNSIKLFDWSLKLWNEGIIEVDDTDSEVLSALIENTETINVIAKAPLLKYIKSAK